MNTILYIFILGLGLIMGSFINCIAWRVYKKISITGRSFCPKCKHQINWYDNIPLISFLVLKARCRNCKKAISSEYPIVEMVTGLLFVLVLYANPAISDMRSILILIRNFLVVVILMIIFIQDFKWYVILDKVSLPSIVLIFLFNILLGFNWLNLLISGIIGGSFFLLQYIISRGKWIGDGDIRLGVLMGVLLGWPEIILALFLAYMIGAIVSVYLLSRRKKGLKSEVPMGTFLTPATLISLLWGPEIIQWYMSLLYL